jgi:formate dehydrogenase major subunit
VLVTNRIPPLTVQGRTVHQVGLPYHWGQRFLTSGDSANDLTHMALDPNVHIQEAKAATCGVRPGRRPRGKALAQFIDDLREEAAKTRSEPADTKNTTTK